MPRTDTPMAIGVHAYTDVFPIIIDYSWLLHLKGAFLFGHNAYRSYEPPPYFPPRLSTIYIKFSLILSLSRDTAAFISVLEKKTIGRRFKISQKKSKLSSTFDAMRFSLLAIGLFSVHLPIIFSIITLDHKQLAQRAWNPDSLDGDLQARETPGICTPQRTSTRREW